MAEDNIVSFIGEQFRRMNLRLDAIEGRLTRIEDRMEHLESRMSAMNHTVQSVVVEIAGINKWSENFSAEMLQRGRRVSALEARA